MTLVAGIDSSTQSCKVVVRDVESGELVRQAAVAHPAGTEVNPAYWEAAARQAISDAGGLDDVAAVAVAAQQHGMVCLDEQGGSVRDAVLWHDTRSATAADALIDELDGGAAAWASAVGSVPLASFTVAKLRWLAEHEPDNVARTAMVCLPHDWLTWRLSGSAALDDVVTDRADASGTGYWSPATGDYRSDLFTLALGTERARPRVLQPHEPAGGVGDTVLGPGTGDNAAAALGLGAQPGDVMVSIGTSGVVSTVTPEPTADASGIIAGFADATGRFLPLVCTLNAVHVLHAAARMLSVSLDTLARLALQAPPGAGGLVLVPYLQGERTPNRPSAAGVLHGITYDNTTPEHLARAAIEGLLCGLADGLDALRANGCAVNRVLLIGGGARSAAVRQIAPSVLELPVAVPAPAEYVADGAARQAAWTLYGGPEPPSWPSAPVERFEAAPRPQVRARYAEARELTLDR